VVSPSFSQYDINTAYNQRVYCIPIDVTTCQCCEFVQNKAAQWHCLVVSFFCNVATVCTVATLWNVATLSCMYLADHPSWKELQLINIINGETAVLQKLMQH